MEKDTTPRYAPSHVIVVKSGEGGGAWNCRVREYIAHPPGSPKRPDWITGELVALEMVTDRGSRWYGFDRCYINSELRMVVEGFNARDEVLRNWEVCRYPVPKREGE